MRKLFGLGIASIAALLACGGSNPKPPTFTKPPGTVAVNFSVDDTANKVYAQGDLQWKGAMLYDPVKNTITKDDTWGGPYATLYDDGPWTSGGHEPPGSTAGDHIWGVTVFATPPAAGASPVDYGYGCIDNVYQTLFGNGWIWPSPPDGKFTVPAGATADIKADGLTVKKFGTTDLQLVIDTNNLVAGPAWDSSKLTVKGSGWAWSEVQLLDDGTKGDAAAGDKKFTYQLSYYVAPTGTKFPHTGLLNSGDKPQFIFVFNGVEYKSGGAAATTGITAAYKVAGGSFQPVAVQVQTTGDKNTYVTIP
jgi:hypothetical protein